MLSSPYNLKVAIASLKKFYQYILQYRKIKEEDYKELVKNIKIYSFNLIKEVVEYNSRLYCDSYNNDYDELLCACR